MEIHICFLVCECPDGSAEICGANAEILKVESADHRKCGRKGSPKGGKPSRNRGKSRRGRGCRGPVGEAVLRDRSGSGPNGKATQVDASLPLISRCPWTAVLSPP